MWRPAVIVVNSHVGRGSVGGRASVFAIERMGFPVWSVPTIVLSWHPGHGQAARFHPGGGDFAAILGDLAGSAWLPEVGAILSGYLGEAGQVDAIVGLVNAVRSRRPDALYLCDPVIGDSGGLFRLEPLATAIGQRLVPLADIATLNRFELGWVAQKSITDNEGLAAAAANLGPKEVIVTSAFADAGEAAALLVTPDARYLGTHATLPNAPHGTGDLFAALYLCHRLDRTAPPAALERALAAVLRLVEIAGALGADEMPLAEGQDAFAAEPRGIALKRIDRDRH